MMAIDASNLPVEFVAQVCEVFAGHWIYVLKNDDGSSQIVCYNNEEHLMHDLMKRYVIRKEAEAQAENATKQ